MRPFLRFCLVLSCAAVGARALGQGHYTLLEQAITSGGAFSSGGKFTLAGAVGQPVARTSRAGGFVLAGGFWSAAIAVQPAGMPALSVAQAQAQIILVWEAGDNDAEIVLEESASLGVDAEWSAIVLRREIVNGEVRVPLPAGLSHRFFRLRRPDSIP